MKNTIAKTLWVLPVVFLFACAAEQAEEEAGEMAAEGYTVEITNPMPHDMTIYVQGEMGETELGTVPANGSASFDLGMPEAMEVMLRATDAGETHSVTGTVTLTSGETATWTVR